MEQIEFFNFCNSGRCLRHTIKSNSCTKQYKQDQCWNKYMRQQNKPIKKDIRWQQTREEVWKRDAGFPCTLNEYRQKNWREYCRFWRCLTSEEQKIFEINFKNELWLAEYLDCAHVVPISNDTNIKYNIDNIVLMNRLIHGLLDQQYKDPLTKEKIDSDKRLEWMKRIRG